MCRFQPGQVWRYKTRPGEESSRLTILRVESYPKLGRIVHIQVNDVALKNPKSAGDASTVISHLPYAEQSLAQSVTTLGRDNVTPEGWEDGYQHWKSELDAGTAGIWTIEVSEAVSAVEEVLGKQ